MKPYILILVILGIVGCGKDSGSGNRDHANKKVLARLQTGRWCNDNSGGTTYCMVFESDGTWKWRWVDPNKNFDWAGDEALSTYQLDSGTITCRAAENNSDVSQICTIIDDTHIQCGDFIRDQRP